ncbi:two-component sensor histidine kinase [Chroococcidiopsis sp. CCALA 051]|nr:two-component sensor histidine kinase [Chroococcidiopsis sp. CCALA 051]
MVTILGIFTVAVYQFVAYNLYQKTDRQMLGLADAAAHSLSKLRADRTAISRQMPRSFDDDGDLDIPWQDLRENHQSVEWYDANRQLLGKAGKPLPDIPLAANSYISQQGQIRTLTIRVYEEKQRGAKQELQGYIRVLESTEELAEELDRLLLGLGVAGIIALSLTSVGSLWLTRQSIKPIQLSFQQLKQLNQQLKQFTADASHELRSPLAAIKTSTQVMMTHPERIHPADVDKLDAIASATKQMTCLVEDLLFLARTDVTETSLTQETWRAIPINELLEDLVDFLSPQAQAKEITLKLDSLEEVFVKGDAFQLGRLFSNLLENALQYTLPGGTVTISIVSQGKFVVISIEDTGIGIAPEHVPLVFHRFWRADKARTYREDGSGLGLAIAQAIAQRHGGEIVLSSQIGVGSCFGVRLPIAA